VEKRLCRALEPALLYAPAAPARDRKMFSRQSVRPGPGLSRWGSIIPPWWSGAAPPVIQTVPARPSRRYARSGGGRPAALQGVARVLQSFHSTGAGPCIFPTIGPISCG